MHPIDILMNEHRAIESMIEALLVLASRIEQEDVAAQADLPRMAAWIHDFADVLHHGKEEDNLFVAMARAGLPANDGPLFVMRQHHEEGRRLVGILAEKRPLWTAEERSRVSRAAGDYAGLLRGHIRIEDDVLYPMAKARVPASAWDAMTREFDAFEAAHAAERTRLTALGSELTSAYSR